MNKYEKNIIEQLLKKQYGRLKKYKNRKIKQRISISTNRILKNYSKYNVDLEEKNFVNQAIFALESKGFITVSKIEHSDDYEKIYLVEESVPLLEEYGTEKYGIIPRSFIINELQNILKKYKNRGKIVDFYISELTEALKNTLMQIDLEKEEDILKILSFLETNEKFLYLREASMLIFGDSKHFENKRKFQVNGVLSQYLSFIDEERFDDENLLKRFNIYDTEQEICLKGPMTIEMYGKEIDVECFSGGVSFSIQDIEKVSFISVRCEEVMTIENKTSFLRMNHPYCYMYLGGFATKAQIAFIKKLFKDNPDKIYSHFGDIDAGGFWIHKKLCEQTGINFQLFHMNKNDLRNPTYSNCLQPLTEQDQKRLCTLKEDLIYGECIHYMLDHNVKLEQEIISLNISNL